MAVWRARELYGYGALLLVPTLVWSVLGVAVFGFLRGQAERSFFPSLYLRVGYWTGWWNRAQDVVGLLGLGAVVAGLVLAQGRGRAVLGAMLAGYAVFGLVFNYHIATHDYYSEQLLLVLAVAGASIAGRVDTALADPGGGGWGSACAPSSSSPRRERGAIAAHPTPAPESDAEVAAMGQATAGADRALYRRPRLRERPRLPARPTGARTPTSKTSPSTTSPAWPRARPNSGSTSSSPRRTPTCSSCPPPTCSATIPTLRAVLDRRYPVRASGPDWVVYDLRRPR